jgi:tetratricopeptide (TPR) repeat protein
MSGRKADVPPEHGSSHAVARAADRHREQGRFDDAIMLCLQELESRPTYVSARVVLGRAYLERGDSSKAEVEFHRVLELSPENLRARMHLGQICEAQGRVNEAIGHYRAVLEFAPLNPEIRASLLRLQPPIPPTKPSLLPVGAGVGSEPVEFQAASGSQEGDEGPFATETLADLYAEQGLGDRAASIYQRLLDEQPSNDRLQRKLDALLERRRADEAAPAKPALAGMPERSTETPWSETTGMIRSSDQVTGIGSARRSGKSRDQLLADELERWLRGVRRYTTLASAQQRHAPAAEAALPLALPPMSP